MNWQTGVNIIFISPPISNVSSGLSLSVVVSFLREVDELFIQFDSNAIAAKLNCDKSGCACTTEWIKDDTAFWTASQNTTAWDLGWEHGEVGNIPTWLGIDRPNIPT